MHGMDRRLFPDCHEAGRRLAAALTDYASRPNLLVLALPREPFVSVGSWYQDFSQLDDEQVRELLQADSLAGQS